MSLKHASELAHGGIITEPGNSEEFKTGDWREMRPVWNSENCINCLFCWMYCPDSSIMTKQDESGKFKMAGISYDHCKGCGICAFHCPGKKGNKALTMEREEK